MADPRYTRAVVVSRRDVSPGFWIVRVAPEERPDFRPGQYVTVGIPGAPRMVERPYSVASSPRDQELEFFLQLVPKGELTPQLYDLPAGAEVWIRRAAKGRFTFDASSRRRRHFMAATATGAAPFVSMIRDFIERGEGQYRVALLQAASRPGDLGYAEELLGYAQACAWFEYIPAVSRPWLAPEWAGERGRVENVLRKHLDRLGFAAGETTMYLCGNPAMVANARGVLDRAGFPREAVKEEPYWVERRET